MKYYILLLTIILSLNSTIKGQFVSESNRIILGVDSINDNVESTFFYIDMDKKATRFGQFVGGQEPSSSNVGDYSAIRGQLGSASGSFSTSIGVANNATQSNSFVNGTFCNATAYHAVSFGKDNTSSGPYSLTSGLLNMATDSFSVAFGYENSSLANNAMSWGVSNKATGQLSTAWGGESEANGDLSTAWGLGNEADSTGATAWGILNSATNYLSTTWGQSNSAIGKASTTWGTSNEAKGENTTSFGRQNLAQGENSTAIGRNNRAHYRNSFVVGQYNDSPAIFFDNGAMPDDQLFVVGNGQNDANRNNALTVLKNGNVGIGITDPESPLHLPAFDRIQMGPTASLYGNSSVIFTNASVFPETNAQNLGGPGNLWNAVYAANGTIQTSDIRLKENILPVKYGLSKIMRLEPISYNLIAASKEREIGFSAQQLESVIPEAVYQNEFIDESGNIDHHYGVKYSEIIPVLTKAIQEQQEMIIQLQQEVKELKERK